MLFDLVVFVNVSFRSMYLSTTEDEVSERWWRKPSLQSTKRYLISMSLEQFLSAKLSCPISSNKTVDISLLRAVWRESLVNLNTGNKCVKKYDFVFLAIGAPLSASYSASKFALQVSCSLYREFYLMF